MIEVRHLTKRYGDTLAVDDLNFTIEKGRIYGFLGPNGAGKSTTMNIITSLPPTEVLRSTDMTFWKTQKPQKRTSVICRNCRRFILI